MNPPIDFVLVVTGFLVVVTIGWVVGEVVGLIIFDLWQYRARQSPDDADDDFHTPQPAGVIDRC